MSRDGVTHFIPNLAKLGACLMANLLCRPVNFDVQGQFFINISSLLGVLYRS